MELKDYTTQELYHELQRRDRVAVCVITETEVMDALQDNDVLPSELAIDYVFDENIGAAMLERALDLIDYSAREYKYGHQED